MGYKVLALDLDGTLTTTKKEISPATQEALIDIQQHGKIVALASGRPEYGMFYLAEALEMERYGGYILAYNGGKIIDCRSGEVLYNRTLPIALAKPIYEFLLPYQDRGVDIICFQPDRILSGIQYSKYNEHEERVNRRPHVLVKDFPSAITTPPNKFLINGDPPLIEEIEEKLMEIYGSQYHMVRSDPSFLEVLPPTIDKAGGLQKLLSHLGLTAEDLICCGDGYNDIGMIEYAGLGVAMGNAQPLVLEKADFVTKTNDEDGILSVIDRFMRD